MVFLFSKFISFFQYWYFRYMLVTELYMVEKWERYFINLFFLTLFCLLFYFNYQVVLPVTSIFTDQRIS